MLPKIPEGKRAGSPRPPPRSDATKRGAQKGAAGAAQHTTNATTAPVVRRLARTVELALSREEELFRSTIEMQQGVDQSNICLELQWLDGQQVVRSTQRSDRALAHLCHSVGEQGTSISQLLGATRDVRSDMSTTRERIEQFFDFLESTERKNMEQLRVDKQRLEITTEQQAALIELQHAEIHALKDQLGRRILRNTAESKYLQHTVRDEIENASISVAELKQQLHERIDGAVLAFQKPTYQTALQSLKDHVEAAQAEIQRQSDSLHNLVDQIGARDLFFDLESDGSTMHTNLPTLYRSELRGFTKDQLLNVLDVVSFEDGVVGAVGKAVSARKLSRLGVKINEESVAGSLLST